MCFYNKPMTGGLETLNLSLFPVYMQVDAGWIGFWSTVGGCIVGVAMAR